MNAPYESLAASFARICAWMQAHGAEALARNLAPGASTEEVRDAESRLGFSIHQDLRALWSLHDGQRDWGNGFVEIFDLLSIEQAIDEHDTVLASLEFLRETPSAVRESGLTEAELASNAWLLFAARDSDGIAVNTVSGRVFEHAHDDSPPLHFLSPSIVEWAAEYAAHVTADDYSVEEGFGGHYLSLRDREAERRAEEQERHAREETARKARMSVDALIDEARAKDNDSECLAALKRAEEESREAFDAALNHLFEVGSPAFIAATLRSILNRLSLPPSRWEVVAKGGEKIGNNAVRDTARAKIRKSSAPPPAASPPPPPTEAGPARRFPLLVGVRAFRLLAIVPAWVVFGLAISQALHVIGPDLPFGLPFRMLGFFGLTLALGAVILPWVIIPILIFGGGRLKRALSTRACDVLVDRRGIRVVGGPAHGFAATFESLAPPNGTQLRADGIWLRGSEGTKWAGKWLHVPYPKDDDERASIEALGATIAAHAAAIANPRTTRIRRAPPGTVHCPSCGAPQAPAEANDITCRHCATRLAIPSEIVEKVRSMRVVASARAQDDRLASAVLAQRGALVANVVAFGGGILTWTLATLTVLVSVATMFIGSKESGGPRVAWVGLIEAGICLVLLGAVGWILAGRRALRLLTVGFGALAPERAGDPPACRRCGGPLANPDAGSAVARCIYCEATNLIAADLRVEGSIIERFGAFAADPHDVLAACARRQRRSRVMVALGVGLVVWGAVSPFLAHRSPRPGPRTALVPFDSTDPGYKAPTSTLVAADGALRVERVARIESRDVLQLLRGEGGSVDALAEGETRFVGRGGTERLQVEPGFYLAKNVFARNLGIAPLRWEPLAEIENARPPTFARLDGGELAFTRDGAIFVRGTATKHVYLPRFWEDSLVLDLADGSGGSVLATTRASDAGHVRVRRIEPNGKTSMTIDDAREPEVSPAGDRVAFSLLVAGRFQIAVAPLARPDEAELLTRGEGHVSLPAWSPDGKKIAFITKPLQDDIHFDRFTGTADLWILDLEGHATRATRGAPLLLTRPVWTNDGIWVLTREKAEKLGKTSGTAVWRVIPK